MQEGYQSYGANNFDPNSLANQTTSVIMFIVVTDVSGSVNSFVHEMNTAAQEVFMKELKNSHRKSDIVIKQITFGETVKHKSGFMPILNMPDDYLDVKANDGATMLYEAVVQAIEHATQYRTDLEDQGVDVRTCIFIITDGQDNASPRGTNVKVQQLVQGLRENEAWINSFNINMLGVGRESGFRDSCVEMGLDPNKMLSVIGTSAAEIRKQMGVVSQSVSSSSAGATVSF